MPVNYAFAITAVESPYASAASKEKIFIDFHQVVVPKSLSI